MKTLSHVPVLDEFIKLMTKRKWVFSLPPDAHKMHHIESTKSGAKRKDIASLETSPTKSSKKMKMELHSKGTIKQRPILGDILNNSYR
jgi:hypothetical protein